MVSVEPSSFDRGEMNINPKTPIITPTANDEKNPVDAITDASSVFCSPSLRDI